MRQQWLCTGTRFSTSFTNLPGVSGWFTYLPVQVTNYWWHCPKWCEDPYSYCKMKCKVTLRRCLVREDSVQGWRNTARLLNCLDSLAARAGELNDPRLSLSCGFGEICLQAPPCLPMFSLQCPGTGGVQGRDGRGHLSSWPSSTKRDLLLVCGWEEPLLSSLHFSFLLQLICCGVEPLEGQLFCSAKH